MHYIGRELKGIDTQVMLVPSIKDIIHFSPYPQHPYSTDLFDGRFSPILLSNPQMLKLNDIRIGISNNDILKDMCTAMLVKDPESAMPPKIDLCL
jgi:hypothetical protein